MRAPNCFILYSIIITVLSSRLVMGRPMGAGPVFNSQPQNSNLQGAQMNYKLQSLLESVLKGVPMLINQLRGVEAQLKNLQLRSYEQVEQVNMIQNFVGGLLTTVETVATQLNAIPNFNHNPNEEPAKPIQSAGSPPIIPRESVFDVNENYDVVREKKRQAMEVAIALANMRKRLPLDR
ncbi:hypothetical protein XELAEV_18040143mg [Xenopus laevis]|uniref:Uncharacterized protein n=1 Tax=Xenopus laevis TaxID=8355 RepID=A0A974H8M3_XENLA|nr:hypothetical protein XELAEV_18040143mg [Xenopus laevis]